MHPPPPVFLTNSPLSFSLLPVSDPGPSSATCRNVDGCGIDSELPPSVDARDLSALSPLGVEASSSSSEVPVPAEVAVMIWLTLRPCFSSFCRRMDFRSSSSFISLTLKSLLDLKDLNLRKFHQFSMNLNKELKNIQENLKNLKKTSRSL